jgi:hypothetical protein
MNHLFSAFVEKKLSLGDTADTAQFEDKTMIGLACGSDTQKDREIYWRQAMRERFNSLLSRRCCVFISWSWRNCCVPPRLQQLELCIHSAARACILCAMAVIRLPLSRNMLPIGKVVIIHAIANTATGKNLGRHDISLLPVKACLL